MPRFRAKSRDRTTRGMVRTSRVRRREIEFIAVHGSCERCGATGGLEAFWRSDDRPLGTIQSFWLAGDEVRQQLADKVIVLCAEHMRVHKGGVEHGGGVAGVKGCSCTPCADKRREYVRGKHAERRARRKNVGGI